MDPNWVHEDTTLSLGLSLLFVFSEEVCESCCCGSANSRSGIQLVAKHWQSPVNWALAAGGGKDYSNVAAAPRAPGFPVGMVIPSLLWSSRSSSHYNPPN